MIKGTSFGAHSSHTSLKAIAAVGAISRLCNPLKRVCMTCGRREDCWLNHEPNDPSKVMRERERVRWEGRWVNWEKISSR